MEWLETAVAIESVLQRVSAAREIAVALTAAGYLSEARELLDNARMVARALRWPRDRAEVLWEIAEAQLEVEDADGAQLSLAEARQAARAVENTRHRVELSWRVARAQAAAGGLAESLRALADAFETAERFYRVLPIWPLIRKDLAESLMSEDVAWSMVRKHIAPIVSVEELAPLLAKMVEVESRFLR